MALCHAARQPHGSPMVAPMAARLALQFQHSVRIPGAGTEGFHGDMLTHGAPSSARIFHIWPTARLWAVASELASSSTVVITYCRRNRMPGSRTLIKCCPVRADARDLQKPALSPLHGPHPSGSQQLGAASLPLRNPLAPDTKREDFQSGVSALF